VIVVRSLRAECATKSLGTSRSAFACVTAGIEIDSHEARLRSERARWIPVQRWQEQTCVCPETSSMNPFICQLGVLVIIGVLRIRELDKKGHKTFDT
jgi:hypothetical protein